MQYRYFAASNSSEGFKSYFAELFSTVDRLYVIKGGPGTGKSGLMKKCASAAERRGAFVEYYACSSDPSSLDGILIRQNGETVGMLDGTLPHPWEPTLPGAREEIVNLGQFWDSGLLQKQKNEIISLSRKKSASYKRAYDYLRSCGNLRAVSDALMRQCLDEDKLNAAAERAVRAMELPEGEAEIAPALISAVSMTGACRLDSFERLGDRVYWIGDFFGVGQAFLDRVAAVLRQKATKLRISYDSVCPRHTDGILIEDKKIALVLGKEESEGENGEKYINPRRFVRAESLREVRGELRYAARLYRDCLDGAIHALSEAKVYHFLLEDIYKNTMDFGALNAYSRELLAKISE